MSNEYSHIKVLFIGNSHTYYHDLPAWVALFARQDQCICEVTMLAHPGWYLKQHVEEPEAEFNIMFGHYDYVVLQEHSHPFDCIPDYREAADTLAWWVRKSGGTPVIYGTWSRKEEPEVQPYMNEVNREIAEEVHALLAPVGEKWWPRIEEQPDIEMYDADGAHASAKGIEWAAKIIWSTIYKHFTR